MSQASVFSNVQDSVTGKVRRSTRVQKTVPLIVLGQNQSGESFMERTLSLSLNMHGCRYSSRHDYIVGTWVTLQIVDLDIPDQKPTTVRAVVRSVHPPANSRELHQVGVELETPANVWGIVPPPTDWRSTGETSTSTAQVATVITAPTQDSAPKRMGPVEVPAKKLAPIVAEAPTLLSPPVPASSPMPGSNGSEAPRPQRVIVSSEGLISALQGRLEREAEKAVQAAATRQLNDWMGKALNSIEEARRSSIRGIQELAAKEIEKIKLAIKEESIREMVAQSKADLEAYRSRAEEISQRLEKRAGELSREMANVRESAEKATLEITPQIPARMKEVVAQAATDFEYSAALIVDRRYGRLLESVQGVTDEAFLKLNARSAEVQALVQTAVNSALQEFRRETELHADMTLSETKERAVSTLAMLDAENRASCDKRRQALETEVARSAERATEQFRTGMKAFMYSCLVAAVGAVDEHSKATLVGLKEEGRALADAAGKSPTHD